MNREASCVVSGSFTKFKTEIDQAVGIFKSRGIKVLSPKIGGLFKSVNNLWTPGSYPLQNERFISESMAKDIHQIAITQADFLYIINPNQYTGESVVEEFGIAYFAGKDIYAHTPLNPKLEPNEPAWLNMIQVVEVKSAREVADLWQAGVPRKFYLYLPRSFIGKQIQDSGFIDYTLPYRERIWDKVKNKQLLKIEGVKILLRPS